MREPAASCVAQAKGLLQSLSSNCQLRAKAQLRQRGRDVHSALLHPALPKSAEEVSQVSAPARTPQQHKLLYQISTSSVTGSCYSAQSSFSPESMDTEHHPQ